MSFDSHPDYQKVWGLTKTEIQANLESLDLLGEGVIPPPLALSMNEVMQQDLDMFLRILETELPSVVAGSAMIWLKKLRTLQFPTESQNADS
jgi:hypothetical protein